MQYSGIVFCGHLCYSIIARRQKGELKMKLSQALLDDRINDNTTVVIKDQDGKPIVCGRWYQDKILLWVRYDVACDFVEERNIAIFQLL